MMASAAPARLEAVSGSRASPAAPSNRPMALVVSSCRPRFRYHHPRSRWSPGNQVSRPACWGGPAGDWSFKSSFGNISSEDIERLQQEIENTFGTSWSAAADNAAHAWATSEKATSSPSRSLYFPVDILEGEDTYTLIADLPGMSRADTKVQANRDDRVLIISGERTAPQQPQGDRQRCTERRFGKFKRTFPLPEDADLNKIMAWSDAGVLTVVVKRIKPAEPTLTDVPINDWIDVEGAAAAEPSDENPEKDAKWDDVPDA